MTPYVLRVRPGSLSLGNTLIFCDVKSAVKVGQTYLPTTYMQIGNAIFDDVACGIGAGLASSNSVISLQLRDSFNNQLTEGIARDRMMVKVRSTDQEVSTAILSQFCSDSLVSFPEDCSTTTDIYKCVNSTLNFSSPTCTFACPQSLCYKSSTFSRSWHDNDGTFSISYQATRAGTYSVQISVDDVIIFQQQREVYGSLLHPASAQIVGLANRSAGDVGVFRVRTTDRFGNPPCSQKFCPPIPELDAELLRLGEADTPLVHASSQFVVSESMFYCSYQLTLSGVYRMTVKVLNQTIGIYPTEIRANKADASRTLVERYDVFTAGKQTTFRIEALDQYSNRLTKGGDDFQVKLLGSYGRNYDGSIRDLSNGSYLASFNVSITGNFSLYLTLGLETVADREVMIIPNLAYGPSSSLVTSILGENIAPWATTFRIQLRDQFMNQLSSCSSNVVMYYLWQTATGGDDQLLVSQNMTCSGGIASLPSSVVRAASYIIEFKINNVHVEGSPFASTVKPAAADPNSCIITTPLISSSSSSSSSSNQSRIVAGTKSWLVVQVLDQFGNEVRNDPFRETQRVVVYLASEPCSPLLSLPFLILFILSVPLLCSPIPSPSFLLPPRPFPYSPPRISALAPHPSSTYLLAGLGQRCFPVCPSSCNLLTGLPNSPQDLCIVANVTDNQDSTFLTEWTPTIADSYQLRILLQDAYVAGGSFLLQVVAGPVSAQTSRVLGLPQTSGAGVSVNFAIETRDSYGNLVTQSGAGFTSLLVRRAQDFSQVVTNLRVDDCSTTPCSNLSWGAGTYETSYFATLSALYTVRVELESMSVQDGPFRTRVTAGALDPKSCVLSGSGSLGGFVSSKTSILLLLRDQFGNDQLGWDGTFFSAEIQWESSLQTMIFSSAGNGTLLAEYTPQAAGSFQLKVQTLFDRVQVSGSPRLLVFTAADDGYSDPSRSVVVGDSLKGLVAGVGGQATLVARNSIGLNRKAGGDAVVAQMVSSSDTGGTIVKALYTQDNQDGTYNIVYLETKAGMYQLNVLLGQNHVLGSPFTLKVIPSSALGRKTLYTPSKSADLSTIAGVTKTVLMVSVDSYDNFIAYDDYILPDKYYVTMLSASSAAHALDVVDNRDGSYQASCQFSCI
eukprot:527907-Hanusia_phi.AAC.2